MQYTRFWTAATIIALFILVGFVISVPRTARDIAPETITVQSAIVPQVLIQRSFKKGVHTVSGSIEAQDACSSIEAFATHKTEDVEHIQVDITLTPFEGVCLELPTKMSFSASVSAGDDLPIQVRVNGVLASTTSP